MGQQWEVIREKFPLAELESLAKATAGASKGWFFLEPTVADVRNASSAGSENEQAERLSVACVVDGEGNKVFTEKLATGLPARAFGEMVQYSIGKAFPKDAEDGEADEGKR